MKKTIGIVGSGIVGLLIGYNFSKLGLKIYMLLVLFGFALNILSDYKIFGKFYYIMSLFEHLIIGAIIALSFFSNIKNKFK